MHTTKLNEGWIVLHNSDWSGDAIVRQVSLGKTELVLQEHVVPGNTVLALAVALASPLIERLRP